MPAAVAAAAAVDARFVSWLGVCWQITSPGYIRTVVLLLHVFSGCAWCMRHVSKVIPGMREKRRTKCVRYYSNCTVSTVAVRPSLSLSHLLLFSTLCWAASFYGFRIF